MKKTSRIIAAIMALIMVIAVIPTTAFAADNTINLGDRITVSVPENGYADYEFTSAKDGKYVIYSDLTPKFIDPIVSVTDADGNVIAENDDSYYFDNGDFYCVFEAKAGESYSFKIAESDGKIAEYRVTLRVYGEIEHQPTVDEPYVKVTKGSSASYRWFKFSNVAEITDKTASPCKGEEGYSAYDSSKGWTGVYAGTEHKGYKQYNILSVNLEAGQSYKFTADCYAEYTGFYCDCGTADYVMLNKEKGEPTFSDIDHTCKYYFYGYYESVPHVRADFINFEMLENETSPELETTEAGIYSCRVIFDGCRFDFSGEFELDGSTSDLGSKRIKNADINIRTDIAGMSVYEYRDYIEILSDNLEFEDNYGDAAVYVYDSNGNLYEGSFINGKTYTVSVFLSPDAGYKLSNSMTATVNGMTVNSYIGQWEPGGQYGDTVVEYVELVFEITVTAPCDHMCHQSGISGFFWNIVNFFNRIFGLNPVCECGAAHY